MVWVFRARNGRESPQFCATEKMLISENSFS